LIGRHFTLGSGLLKPLVLADETRLQTGRKHGSTAETHDEHQAQTDPQHIRKIFSN
jgi:hypothetical protein